MPKVNSAHAKRVSFAKLKTLDVMSAPDAAKRLGIDRSSICRYYDSGVLGCVTHGNRVYVMTADVERLRVLRRKQAKVTKRGGATSTNYRRMKMNGLPRNA